MKKKTKSEGRAENESWLSQIKKSQKNILRKWNCAKKYV